MNIAPGISEYMYNKQSIPHTVVMHSWVSKQHAQNLALLISVNAMKVKLNFLLCIDLYTVGTYHADRDEYQCIVTHTCTCRRVQSLQFNMAVFGKILSVVEICILLVAVGCGITGAIMIGLTSVCILIE